MPWLNDVLVIFTVMVLLQCGIGFLYFHYYVRRHTLG